MTDRLVVCDACHRVEQCTTEAGTTEHGDGERLLMPTPWENVNGSLFCRKRPCRSHREGVDPAPVPPFLPVPPRIGAVS